MKREVDHLAVTTTASRSVIWDIVRGRFYGNPDTNTAFSGLRREDVFRRVNRARHEEYGGSLYGQIESPPWSQVLNGDGSASETNFHLFHYSYYDKSKKKRERLLGWGHPVLLNMLKQKRTDVFVDGTFKTVPPKFKQCLIFSTYDRPTRAYYPAAFILCTSKKYAVYFHAMRLLLDKTDYAMDPEFVCCDFEAGLIRAIRDHFPQGLPVGCLCHLKQACRRKMKAYGIPDDQCRVAMRSGVLDMLTVIKQDKVKGPGLLWVQEKITTECLAQGIVVSTDKWTKFWKYFKRTWITTFPPSLWNIEPYTKALVSRTNNPSERFNREMNAAFPAPHPNLADFVSSSSCPASDTST
ncbi:hypothetical protein PR002_g24421 [Phytophthora rubi]|uniref:MULE transposase domain-containing protein n=1 Tax=Phytophthora rubi TaxID=129364 RepID=A0A6A3IBQ7_9STRA|nr:hypothetical protein PR002_g24421 [Phytophthora rubi]